VTVGCLFAADRLVLRHVRHTFIVDFVVIGVAAYVGTLIAERFWLREAIRHLRGRLTEMGRCAGCGYNLTGNTTGVCPECGAAMPAEAKP
jgi:rRNA maturation endonuclease Nob1